MTQPQPRRRHLIIWWTFGALALASATAWGAFDSVKGNGRIVKQTRPLAAFTGVALSLPAQVDVRIGSTESVTIEVDENLLALIETPVEKGTLEIRAKRGANIEARSIKVTVQARQIDRLALGGAGTIDTDALRSPKLLLEVGGSGSINVKSTESETVSAALGGSGSVKLAGGNTRKLSVSIGGSGDVHAGQLKAADVEVSIGGSGDATVWASHALQAAVAGSGDVNYYGDPKVQSAVVGSGGAKRLGPAPR